MMRFFCFLLVLTVALFSAAASAEAADAVSEDRLYTNPAPIHAIGDPAILYADGAYWMFSTSAPNGYIVWKSTDLVEWTEEGLAFKPDLRTSWCTGSFWAPEVHEVNGAYYLFYSALWYGHNTMRIGIAKSDAPGGPYVDLKNEPLFDLGYAAIDASLFIDNDGTPYLYFSRDCSENVINGINTSQIYVVELTEDFMGIVGEPQLLLTPDQSWEYGPGDTFRWNEGPFIVENEGKYWLFYSANFYQSREYGVGAAVSDSPTGPFVKLESNPIMKWAEDEAGKTLVSGPGHNFYFRMGDELFTSYHTHYHPHAPSENRQLAVDRMGFHADGTPYINGPTLAGQLKPLAQLGLKNAMTGAALAGCGAAAEGSDPAHLTDGDYGVFPSGSRYCWQPADAENAWIEYRWDDPQRVDSVLIYPLSGAAGTGKIILNETVEFPVDFDQTDRLPGSFVSCSFEAMEVTSLRLEMANANALAEIIAIG